MIFLGDIASPHYSSTGCLERIFLKNQRIFSGKRIICNLEGLIYDGPEIKLNEPILYNHSSVLNILNQGQSSVLCLANNHILDLPGQFDISAGLIRDENMLYTGAGPTIEEAEKEVIFNDGDRTFALFNACWDFLLYNHSNPNSGIHVAEIKEKKLLERIRNLRIASPDTLIVTYFHWSLDLETLPFPIYRIFSRALIEAGTDLVIGAHSHCIQGGEIYRNRYIIYGLGNFFIPDQEFAGNNLRFPDFTKLTMAFEWDTDKALCHWFEYSSRGGNHDLKYIGSEDFKSSIRLSSLSPFRDKDDEEYLRFYKINRRKKILIPVYKDHNQTTINALYTVILKVRAKFAHFLARIRIIKWQR